MYSSQTTETTESLPIEEVTLQLMAPICKEISAPVPANLVSTLGPLNPGTVVCGGDVNCNMTGQRGATIVSPILLGLTGTIGQIWALVYLHFSTRRQNQRTIFYLLLCILIWTDFFGKMLTTPPAIISYSYGAWKGGKPMCDFHGFSMVFISLLTHFTVSAMSVERFLGICHGYFYGRNVTASRCKMVFFGIWMFSFAFSVLPLFHVGRFYQQYPGTWCFANIHLCAETPVLQKFFTTTLGIINVTNLIIIVVCNVMVVGSLLKMRITPHLAFQQGQPHRNRKKNEQELQMVILLIIITCVFVVSWAPLDVILITNQALPPHGPEDHFQELVAIRLVSINQIVDPYAYIISRVVFRSKAWKCCHRAIMGRGWSRRGDGNSHFQISSLLHTRKFSRTQSPPKEQIAAIKEEHVEEGTSRPQPEKTNRAPSVHRSYYSDSGTGSYSGVETPLVDKLEDQPFPPESFQGSKGTALQQSLVKSLSVAIPIPLFTSEQYKVAECGKEEDVYGHTRDIYCLVDGGHKPIKQRVSNSELCMSSAGSARNRTNDCAFITVSGFEDGGVYRSNSWGCQSIKPPQPQYRTQSTQTLVYSTGNYPDSQTASTDGPKEMAAETKGLQQQDNPEDTSSQQQAPMTLNPEDLVKANSNVRRVSSLTLLQPSYDRHEGDSFRESVSEGHQTVTSVTAGYDSYSETPRESS